MEFHKRHPTTYCQCYHSTKNSDAFRNRTLSTAYCPLPTAYCQLSTAYCSLNAAYCLMSILYSAVIEH